MATANPLNVTPVKGKLVSNPTDLSAVFPFGGTELGIVRDRRFSPNIRSEDVTAEEFGGVAIDSIFTLETAIFAAVLREYDPDMRELVFPSTTSHGGTRTGVDVTPGGTGVRPGSFHGDRAFKLLFVPDDHETHPLVILYNAIPMPVESAALSYTVKEDIGLGVVFKAGIDSSGRAWAEEYKDKMTL